MYHILAPQRQAQFGTGQPIDCFDTQTARGGGSREFFPSVGRPILRLTGYFLDRHVLHGPQAKGTATDKRMAARSRFLDRLTARSRRPDACS